MSKPKGILCDLCGRPGLQTKLVTRSYGKGASLLVIEGIPLHSCPHCGETYLTADTLHEVERIRALRKAVSVVRPVPVATFA
jgi:YgiT-type zinc finger domain-containing protein